MKILLLALVIAFSASAFGQTETKTPDHKSSILKVMNEQVEAWNRGDIKGFMEGYWNSEEMRFVSGNSVSKGWQAAYDRYKVGYDTREKMGKLLFSEIEVTALDQNSAFVTGRFTLERVDDKPTGLFTLIFRKIEGKWRIVLDHTST